MTEHYILSVTFKRGGKLFDYWSPSPVRLPCRVVVDSPFQGYQVVEVERCAETAGDPPEDIKRIVSPIDDTLYLDWARAERNKAFERSAH